MHSHLDPDVIGRVEGLTVLSLNILPYELATCQLFVKVRVQEPGQLEQVRARWVEAVLLELVRLK